MSLYILRWIDGETVSDGKTIFKLAIIFESVEIKFKVSNGLESIEQTFFGFGGFKYWLNKRDNFDKVIK